MTHPASIFPISALAVSAILLLSSCTAPSAVLRTPLPASSYAPAWHQSPLSTSQQETSADRIMTKSALALAARITAIGEAPPIG